MRRLNVSVAFALLFAASPVVAAPLLLDDFLDPFGPNPCLPASNQPVLFVGSFCDGLACPPALRVSACYPSATDAGAIPAAAPDWARFANLYPLGVTVDDASASVDPTSGRLRFDCPSGQCFTALSLRYEPLGAALDLPALGVDALHIAVDGAMNSQVPLRCYVLLEDTWTGLFGTAVGATSAPGDLVLPLSSFTLSPGFDLGHVNWIVIEFGDCSAGGCHNQHFIPNFSAGDIRFSKSSATTVHHASWGALKSIYR